MSDLVEFLRARLDEDEAVARAATGGPWRHNPDKHWRKPGTSWFEEAVFAGPGGKDATCIAGTGETDDPQSMRDAAHIARHDPARVLRDVEAKRWILGEHLPERPDLQQYEPQACAHCFYGGAPTEMHPCPTLRLLALPYGQHPDYDPSWAPDN